MTQNIITKKLCHACSQMNHQTGILRLTVIIITSIYLFQMFDTFVLQTF